MNKTILIVEDHPDALEFFEEVLQEHGYHVLTAENGRKGLDLAQANKLDALLLDVNVPQVSGREIYETLRKQAKYKSLPIVFITAEQGDDVSDLVAKPHTHYMKKAIDIHQLLKLLADILG